MRISLSIPDALFKKAEREARRRGVSRSALYRQAMEQFLPAKRQVSDVELTWRINKIHAKEDSAPDPAMTELARRRLRETEW